MILECENEEGETYYECDKCHSSSWIKEELEHKKDCYRMFN